MTDRTAPHLDGDLADMADPFPAFARWREQAPVHLASTPAPSWASGAASTIAWALPWPAPRWPPLSAA